MYILFRSYPATFLTTCPPDRTTVPSAWTTRAPMTRSLAVPKDVRNTPEALVASTPPRVPASPWGGSSGRNWPRFPSPACSPAMVMPASTVAVWSAGSCATIRFRRFRDTTISAREGGWPKSILVPPPRGMTA